MLKTPRVSCALVTASLVFSLVPVAAHAVSTIPVTVRGTQYYVTNSRLSYGGDVGKFATFGSGGEMPWWGDRSLAQDFAASLGFSLGSPNTIFNPNDAGPFFAWRVSNLGYIVGDAESYIGSVFTPVVTPGFLENEVLSFASASLTPPASASSAPAPLPLFGAAAAFGMARRLRRRIQQES